MLLRGFDIYTSTFAEMESKITRPENGFNLGRSE